MPVMAPCPVEVTAGKRYAWCACGRSQQQPFCDGSHKGSGVEPVEYLAGRNKIVFFCTCRKSKTAPVCDGTHSTRKT